MKIGIVTLGGYYNYGNRLQNFALYKTIQAKLGHEVLTIVTPSAPIVRPVRNFKNVVRFFLKDLYRYRPMKMRARAFKQFTVQNTKEFIPKSETGLFESESNLFSKIIVGSDQVWNFNFLVENELGLYLLSGVESKKRIAYAASMGNPPVKSEFHDIFKTNIKQFDSISVREEATANYLEEEFSINSEVVVDPVFLLTKDEWQTYLDVSHPAEKYVFTYFLSKPSKKFKDFINQYANTINAKVISFQSLSLKNRKFFAAGPEKFVGMISGAQAVFTDSFHASAFSSIFEVPYIVDNGRFGGSMSSRVQTLIHMTQTEGTIFGADTTVDTVNNIDYDNARSNLSKLREKSIAFLEEAVNS